MLITYNSDYQSFTISSSTHVAENRVNFETFSQKGLTALLGVFKAPTFGLTHFASFNRKRTSSSGEVFNPQKYARIRVRLSEKHYNKRQSEEHPFFRVYGPKF